VYEISGEMTRVCHGRPAGPKASGGTYDILERTERFPKIIVDLHFFNNVNGAPCGHLDYPG
jgi:hypothetical protein